jgi:ABC-2 type transport system ATP-binding protein
MRWVSATPATAIASTGRPAMTAAIRTEGLTKHYGKVVGIHDLDLEVREGEVFGFLGPNGAGKSTTIRTILDLLHPTSGSATVLGLDSRRDSLEIRRHVGYLPGELAMYDQMTGRQMLEHFAGLRSMPDLGSALPIAERLALDLDVRIRSYSSGNRQKLALALVMMHRPRLLILDEPTTALDPLIQLEFYGLIDEVRDDGRTVFVSSHVLPEVERLADRVGIIRNGTLVDVEDVDHIRERAVRKVELRFAEPVSVERFERLPAVREVTSIDRGRGVIVWVEGSVDPVIKEAALHHTTSVLAGEGDLEEVFLSYYRDPEPPTPAGGDEQGV